MSKAVEIKIHKIMVKPVVVFGREILAESEMDMTRLSAWERKILTHCGRVMQICVFNTVNHGTSASSP